MRVHMPYLTSGYVGAHRRVRTERLVGHRRAVLEIDPRVRARLHAAAPPAPAPGAARIPLPRRRNDVNA